MEPRGQTVCSLRDGAEGMAWYGSVHFTPVSFAGWPRPSLMRGCGRHRPVPIGKPLYVVLDTELCIGGV